MTLADIIEVEQNVCVIRNSQFELMYRLNSAEGETGWNPVPEEWIEQARERVGDVS